MAEPLHPVAVQAQRACAEAVASTADAYQKYLIFLPQRKNIGTPKQPKWITFELPYISVDGRVAMLIDEHRQAGKTLNIGTTFQEMGEVILCRADILSEILGASCGHAQVNIGGGGVDRTNPYENAETSAIGRALGFLGYGLFGHGIASADEVAAAQAQPQEKASAGTSEEGAGRPALEAPMASKAQINALLGLAERHGLTKRLDEALLTAGLDIQQLPLATYKRLLEKLHAAIEGDDGGPDYEAFERQAKAEAQAAREAVDDPEDAAFLEGLRGKTTQPALPGTEASTAETRTGDMF